MGLYSTGSNPGKRTVDVIAAELTNHLIPVVVLTPPALLQPCTNCSKQDSTMHANATARLAATLLGLLASAAVAQENLQHGPQAPNYKAEVFPPWQHGANNDALDRGLEFTVPEVDDLADFHGDISDPKLVLYVGGNYFFAMAPVVQAFERQHPEYKGRLYWETLPPGLLVQQIKANGVVTSGNMTWTAKADVYLAGLGAVRQLVDQGMLERPAVAYVTNTLTIMVPKANPRHVVSLADLADPTLRLAMPNPEFEGVARQIKESLRKVGGDALVTGLNCQSNRLEKIGLRPNWRSEGDSNRGYGFLARHAVQIESDLRPQSSKPEYFKLVPELLAIPSRNWPNTEPGDHLPIRKSLPLAGLSRIAEGKTSKRRTGGREVRMVGSTALLFHHPMSNDLAQN